jgi:SAM-dependent methyltransferase
MGTPENGIFWLPYSLLVDQISFADDVSLDIACGGGRNSFFLAQRGCDVVAIDRAARLARIARIQVAKTHWACLGRPIPRGKYPIFFGPLLSRRSLNN